MSASPYKQLEQEFKRLHAFRGALALLRWDAAVMMPRGSADIRGEQLAALETEHHALLTAPRITRLLDRAQANTQGLADWQIANLHEMRRQRDHAIATPATLVSRLTKAASRAESRWLEARAQGKFEAFAPYLEEVVHLVRDKAALLGQALNLAPYDALVDEFSPGLTTADIDAMFKALSRRLPSRICECTAVQEPRPLLPLTGKFPPGKQRALAVEVMKSVGFPFERGRLDESEHPFTEGVPGDIRVTTRFDPDDIFSGLLGALHETGHAMYDLGLPQDWRDQPVGRDRGMALEESQSLLIEMMVCRSRPFVRYVQPLLAKHFGASGPEWDVENVYGHLTRVRRGLIRVDADELTYPLHIMLRYELEKKLRSGELAVRDLAEAWSAGMEQRLGIRPSNDVEGCLQDIHWAVGSFGYFPSYALGAVIAAQLYESLRAEVQGLDEQLARGEFSGLFGWLRTNVHGLGAKVPVQELLKGATGKPLSATSFVRYVEAKYLESAASSSPALRTLSSGPAAAPDESSDSYRDPRRSEAVPHPAAPGGAAARRGRQGDWRLPHDRRRRPRDGVHVGRQGLLHAAGHSRVAQTQRPGELRAHRRQSRSEATRISRAGAAAVPGGPGGAVARHRAGHLQRREARRPAGTDALRPVLAAAARGAVPLRRRERHHQDRARPSP